MSRCLLSLTIWLALLPLNPLEAQNLEARKIPDAHFVRVEFVKFKPGGEDRAFELEDRYFIPAWQASSLAPPIELHMQTGPWDRVYIYELKGGAADLAWQVSPERARLLAALAKVAGSPKRALEIVSEWDGLVERREAQFGHKHPAQ